MSEPHTTGGAGSAESRSPGIGLAMIYPIAAPFLAWGAFLLVARAPSNEAIWLGALVPVGIGSLPVARALLTDGLSVPQRVLLFALGVCSSLVGGIIYAGLLAAAARGIGEQTSSFHVRPEDSPERITFAARDSRCFEEADPCSRHGS
jgi:hypothetical protein